MILFRTLRHVATRCDGAVGAEFAVVFPLLLAFLLGIIDVGRYMWEINQLEKATQMGARMAVVTDMVATDLGTVNFATTLGQGNPIPTSSFGSLHCDKSGGSLQCVCDSNCTSIGMTANSTAFDAIVTRMQKIAPITGANVKITYTNSGLGYAGDPNGPDVAPIVTVTAENVVFTPLLFQFFGARTHLPKESASLTLEDALGTTSN